MNVTLGSTFSWDPVPGAYFDLAVLNGIGDPIVGPLDNGPANSVVVSTLLSGQNGGQYTLRVRSKNPDGTLPSAWSDLVVTLVGFPAPTGLTVA